MGWEEKYLQKVLHSCCKSRYPSSLSEKGNKVSHIVLVINDEPKLNSSILPRTTLEKTWIHFLIPRNILFKPALLENHPEPPAKVSPFEIHNPVAGSAQVLRTMARLKVKISLPESQKKGESSEWSNQCFFLNLLENQFQSHRVKKCRFHHSGILSRIPPEKGGILLISQRLGLPSAGRNYHSLQYS